MGVQEGIYERAGRVIGACRKAKNGRAGRETGRVGRYNGRAGWDNERAGRVQKRAGRVMWESVGQVIG